jgi:hypothetical protein
VNSVLATPEPQRQRSRLVLSETVQGTMAFGFQFAGSAAKLPLTLCIDDVSVMRVP